MGFEQEEAQRRGLLTMLQDQQEVVWEYGAEVDGWSRPGVWCRELCNARCSLGFRSIRWEGALWVLDSEGGMQQKVLWEISRRKTWGCWNNPSLGWGSLAPGMFGTDQGSQRVGSMWYVVRVSSGLGGEGAGGRTLLQLCRRGISL